MVRRICPIALIFAMLASAGLAQVPPVPTESEAKVEGKPRLFVGQRAVDWGTVLDGDIVQVSWLLENQGLGDLIIKSATSSCGCTVVKLSEEEKIIHPGETLELRADFNSTRRPGQQAKSVTVMSNDPSEPKLKVGFTANVVSLFDMTPSSVVNLRHVQRGLGASKTVDITLGPGRKTLEVLEVRIEDDTRVGAEVEPFVAKNGTPGARIRFTVTEQAPLGNLITSAVIKLKVDDLVRERTLQIRGEIVGDLTWQPKVVDATRQRSMPGKRLAPVTIRSPARMPFDILEASAGPLLEVEFEQAKKARKRLEYTVFLTVREDAPPGPFGTTLEVRTTCLEQPLISVPVFGIIAPLITVDPPLVLLRQDGTEAGTQRRVKLRTSPRITLDIAEATCALGAVTVEVSGHPSPRHRHMRSLTVRLADTLAAGMHETVLTLKTSVPGAETLEIPVIIDVPGP